MDLTKKRIILIDDMEDIHNDFRKILAAKENDHAFENLRSMIFQHEKNRDELAVLASYEIDSAYQGQEGLELVKNSLVLQQPYALAFVDIRMPPGWDGIETIKQIWKIDPDIQVVICTAHADYSWEDMSAQLSASDNFLILKKPFDPIEIVQLAAALTKKWELKRRLLQQIATLETTVEQRTADLFKAKQIAEKANLIKSEFLRNMSHELFTPINGVLGFANLLMNEQFNSPAQKDYSQAILSSANHLAQMINDMFYISIIEDDNFELQSKLEKINMLRLINEVKEMHDMAIKEKQLQFHVNIDSSLTHIVADQDQLRRVLFHLISNAVKFTPKNGQIDVHAFPVNHEQFRINIIDSGIGIRKEDIPKLFVTFQQLDSSMSKKYQGVGMGLALVRKIVESQGGEVGIDTHDGPGSTFFIILPKQPKIVSHHDQTSIEI